MWRALLTMPAVHIGHLLALGRAAIFDDEVSLPYAKVDGGMVLSQSKFAKGVDLDGITIGQSLSITEDASIVGPLSMTFAHIGANLDLTAGRFNSVDLTGSTIGAEIRLASKGYAAITWGPQRAADPAQCQRQGAAGSARGLADGTRSGRLHLSAARRLSRGGRRQ